MKLCSTFAPLFGLTLGLSLLFTSPLTLAAPVTQAATENKPIYWQAVKYDVANKLLYTNNGVLMQIKSCPTWRNPQGLGKYNPQTQQFISVDEYGEEGDESCTVVKTFVEGRIGIGSYLISGITKVFAQIYKMSNNYYLELTDCPTLTQGKEYVLDTTLTPAELIVYDQNKAALQVCKVGKFYREREFK